MEADEVLDSAALLARLRDTPTDELEATFRELDTLHNATSAHRLLVLAVLDERDVGRRGRRARHDRLARPGPPRLSRSARGRLWRPRVRSSDRPEITNVALEGRLSGEQLEAVVQVATPETDAVGRRGAGLDGHRVAPQPRRQRTVTNEEAIEHESSRSSRFGGTRSAARFASWLDP